jgi:AraC-like DNA-binding protein
MERVMNFNNISDYNHFNNHETLHPLVSVLDLSKAKERQYYQLNFGIYCIVLKDVKCGDLRYGRHYYDYQEGTLVFFGPGQTVQIENNGEFYQPIGHALVFHPDLIHGTSLGKIINNYSFFSYNTSEALHVSEKERQIVLDCFHKISFELERSIDKHSKKLIASNIELFLNYCDRFYDRQFITRDKVNNGILDKFETLLNEYYTSSNPQVIGLPSVAWCAEALHLSANYFGDLIKKETGKSAQEYIQNRIIDLAKNMIFGTEKTVNEIALQLGFKYPQHFSRLFKQRVGHTPNEYRKLN